MGRKMSRKQVLKSEIRLNLAHGIILTCGIILCELITRERLVSSQVSIQSSFVLFDSGGKRKYHGVKYRSVVGIIIFIQWVAFIA